MSLELNLLFPGPDHVIVHFDGVDIGPVDFSSPISDENRKGIRWYLETYAARYTTDVDDHSAERIASRLPEWGKALFDAVFYDQDTQHLFNKFQDRAEPGRLLAVSAEHPAILSLPWELLHPSARGGTFLFHEDPRISIIRRVTGATGGRGSFKVTARPRLRLLFVVSRPEDAGFIDPRSDPEAVMDALDACAPGRVDVEFLRPATLKNLWERLENLPPVDIVHFDGHGVFDSVGIIKDQARQDKAIVPEPLVQVRKEADADTGANTGYLLFEKPDDGKKHLVSAQDLGVMLHRKQVSLVVLSACESAAVGGEEPMGSVAARLIASGIPAVLAMAYPVLVSTTRQLFGEFYRHLAGGKGIGTALDNARRELYAYPEKHEVQRGENRVRLKLYDWFVPTLYRAGKDTPLLKREKGHPVEGVTAAPRSKPPELQEAGFFGRRRELWDIERWFMKGTRRVTITGFGGMGKTYLAQEAGRWLRRTGMFRQPVFVGFASFQGVDPVGFAVSTMAAELDTSLVDAAAAAKALRRMPTLLILDNLEALGEAPLRELLDAAGEWSEVGESRVLLTTRIPDLNHPDYPQEGSFRHRTLPLEGLDKEDALNYFQALMSLPPAPQTPPPEREGLVNLFKTVDFHPLSINLLARQLKDRRLADVGERLEKLLAETPDNPLIASLNLSLERADPAARKWLPKLGVFQGGAMEPDLLAVTEIPEKEWPAVRQTLQAAALIQPERLPGVGAPYLKFHPTLAPVLWSRLSPGEQADLIARHRRRYYELSRYLYREDSKSPHHARAIARRELPNLLNAVYGALDAGAEWAVEFADNLNRFLRAFGLNRDRAALAERAGRVAGEKGSRDWFLALSNRGEQLYEEGRLREAEAVFRDVLDGLGETPGYERCITLPKLGRCLEGQGLPDRAAGLYRQALEEVGNLETTESVKREKGTLLADLGNALMDMGDYEGARKAYKDSLAIEEEVGDLRGAAVAKGQLGTLALRQGRLKEAAERYREALVTFQRLNEPASEAVFWHQLGMVFQKALQWDEAERAYRESARIKLDLGIIGGENGAATTWNQLALVCEFAGKPEDAEAWYRKSIEGSRETGGKMHVSVCLCNLAALLQDRPGRLEEAGQLAEEALAIKKTLEPGAAEIWKTYNVLAKIAEKQDNPARAREYRRLARQACAAFAGVLHELRQHAGLITAVVAGLRGNAEARELVGKHQEAMQHRGESWKRMAHVLEGLLAGERDPEMIENLDFEQAVILETILQGIKNPESLKTLFDENAARSDEAAADASKQADEL